MDTETPPAEDASTSVPATYALLTKQLCMHGGSLLTADIPKHVGLTPEHIADILSKEGKRFPEPMPGTVMVQSPVRLCSGYLGNRCQATDCGSLHLCRYFMLGRCFTRYKKHGNVCKFSHNIHEEGNRAVLKANGISNLNEKELQVLLQLNDPSCLPEVCFDYKGDNTEEPYHKAEECHRLHVCLHFVRGQCRYQQCNRSHNLLDGIAFNVIKKRGLSEELINNIQLLRNHQWKEARQDHWKLELPKDDKNKGECPQMSYHLPYRWQIQKVPGVWEDLPCMEDIEKAFSDPNNNSSALHNIHFEEMISSFHQVRRLSATSSVTHPRNHLMTTEWVWRWKNEHGKWIEYGKHGGKQKATITSEDLEKRYLADEQSVVLFQAGEQQYQINFKDMIQKNLAYGTEKEVRRRPRFVSKEDIDKLKACGRATTQRSNSGQGIPSYWDRNAVPDVGYKLIQIDRYSVEFKEIEESFELTMTDHYIQKVQRIQNITLWKFYQMQKETMKKQNRRNVLEKKLYHGTNMTHLHAICQNNFDWRICGMHGTLYGKGSYFARDASYSDNYCDSNSSSKTMFVARVLVGDFVRGHNHYTRPPPRPYTQDTFYDSCVDKDRDPSIFVVFEKHQIYPEYIIEYKDNYHVYPEYIMQYSQTPQNSQTVQNSQTPQYSQTLQNSQTLRNSQTLQNSQTLRNSQTLQTSQTLHNSQTLRNSQALRNSHTLQNPQTPQGDTSCCIL